MNTDFITTALLAFCFFMLAVSNLRAQTSRTCGILPMDSATFVNKPWHGNNQFLLDLNDSIGYPTANPKNGSNDGFDTQTVYWIPIKAWVYNDDNGNGGISHVEVEESIRSLNRHFSGVKNTTGQAHPHTLIQFYLKCNISYLNNSNYALDPSDNEVTNMFGDHHHPAAMNVHYIQTSNDFSGTSEFPGGNISFTCAVVTGYNAHLNSTLPHEIGHALDVPHTHEPRCFLTNPGSNADCANCHQEAVSRAKIQPVGCGNFSGDLKCELNGDA